MTVHAIPWEGRLLALAQEGLEGHAPATYISSSDGRLEAAYAQCEAITADHSRTFFLASGLLPPDERRAARALYAFCRTSDDLVDRAQGDILEPLEAWRQCTLAAPPTCDDPVAQAWADTRVRYRIPVRYAEQLIAGVTRDVTTVRYATFEDLAAYCYGVASTVGLMAMHIIGYAGRHAIPYAVKLGVALQLTNILRDVGEDWQAGRLYLPQDELARFGLTEDDIAMRASLQPCAHPSDERWRKFMCFQINRTRQLYADALPGIKLLNRSGRFAIGAAAELYCAILNDIERHDYDVFSHRSHIGAWGKLRRLPGIWWRTAR